MDELLQILGKLGGSGTTYQITRAILGRDCEHPEDGKDWDFLNAWDDVRTRMRRAHYANLVTRMRETKSAPAWIYRLPDSAGATNG